jgi:hypothetical protein
MSIFSQHGVEYIMGVVEDNVEWMFGDPELDEIGSSDVSCCVHNVCKDLGVQPDDVDQIEWSLLRNAVNNTIFDVREKFDDLEFA